MPVNTHRPLVIQNGDKKELPKGDRLNQILEFTTNTTLTLEQSGNIISNAGASSRIEFTLPDADSKGIEFEFCDDSGHGMDIITAGNSPGDIIVQGENSTEAGGKIRSEEINSTTMLRVSKLGEYKTVHSYGQWGIDPS